MLLVGFHVLGHIRPYSYALSGLDEGSATSYLASPTVHSPVGQLFSLDIHGVAYLCAISD